MAAADDNQQGGRGGRPNFSTDEDTMLVRKEYAARAHVARYWKVRSRFEEAAARANAKPDLMQNFSWKSVQEWYAKLQEAFDKCDTVTKSRTSVRCGGIRCGSESSREGEKQEIRG